jgi:DNA polymerase III delta prime subunit
MNKLLKEIDLNDILGREGTFNEIKDILDYLKNNNNNIKDKKGIYIYGPPGCGKSKFVVDLLEKLDYDIIKYDAGDVRNKNLIETMNSNSVSNRNVLNMIKRKERRLAIIMDEIDGMNNGDRGGITALIKLIRQKKTKKQLQENTTINPIICIGNYHMDKKIRELMKVCYTFELHRPTNIQIKTILTHIIPDNSLEFHTRDDIVIDYIQNDMRKLEFIHNLYTKDKHFITNGKFKTILQKKTYNDDTKNITKNIINNYYPLEEHNTIMNETERTIVALLWHENIIDMFSKFPSKKVIPLYIKILNNICFADYTDRITFQNQIWQFNEMTSLIKTFYNNKIYHNEFPENQNKFQPEEVRFTKILTKYSTEYNNLMFITNLCQELELDKKDLLQCFQELRIYFKDRPIEKLLEFTNIFNDTLLTKLDIKRIYRYLDKNVKKETIILNEFESDTE